MADAPADQPRWVVVSVVVCLIFAVCGAVATFALFLWDYLGGTINPVVAALPLIVGLAVGAIAAYPLKYSGRDFNWSLLWHQPK